MAGDRNGKLTGETADEADKSREEVQKGPFLLGREVRLGNRSRNLTESFEGKVEINTVVRNNETSKKRQSWEDTLHADLLL